MIALCALVAAACAVWSVSPISLLPPGIVAAADGHRARADARIARRPPKPLIGDAHATEYDYETLQTRAVLIATLATTEPGLECIAPPRRASTPATSPRPRR